MKSNKKPFNFRAIPQDGHLWFLADDVCSLLGVDTLATLKALPQAYQRSVEVENIENGKKCHILSVKGLFALIRHYQAWNWVAVAEFVKEVLIPDLGKEVPLDPATIAEFDSELEALRRMETPQTPKR